MNSKPKPIFNKRIFWDVVFENIDYDAKANFVIERVFEPAYRTAMPYPNFMQRFHRR
jgi:hypothetical protein